MTVSDVRAKLTNVRRVVVKIGSSLLTDPTQGLARNKIADYSRQIAQLIKAGFEVALVSSGAVAEGAARLGLGKRPEAVHELQAAAAVGQIGLAHAYEEHLGANDCVTAMVMLTHDDLADRQRYLNARATLHQLMLRNVVPVINENDTVATDEIRFGDNDTLAAMVANLIEADLLIILSDVAGLLAEDPNVNPKAERIPHASASDASLDQFPGETVGLLGRGGMISKIKAARLAARSGAHTVIADGRTASVIHDVLIGEDVGSLLTADVTPLTARKRWIANQLRAKGAVIVDQGAANALRSNGVSLLAVGVQGVSGEFGRGDVVAVRDEQGVEIAQGLVNYSTGEVERLKGAKSEEFAGLIDYVGEPELIHRDNLVVL